MRERLKPLVAKLKSAHAGLLMQRGLPVWETSDKKEKRKLLETLSKVTVPSLYTQAFNRWQAITQDEGRFATVAGSLAGRLLTGMNSAPTLESGVTVHHTYGMPILMGSSIKGATRAYAQLAGVAPEVIALIFGAGDEDSDSTIEESAGMLVWHDAWWVPRKSGNRELRPFVKEVVTVHEQEYYSGKADEAIGVESPIPTAQIAVQGDFYFVIEGEPNWARFAADLLNAMLQSQGMGAKTASGYGYFIPNEDLDKWLNDQTQKIKIDEAVASGDDSLILRERLLAYPEKELYEGFSKDRNSFIPKLGFSLDDAEGMKKLCTLLYELRKEEIEGWKGGSKNPKRAYKLIIKHL